MAQQRFANHAHGEQFGEFVVWNEAARAHVHVGVRRDRLAVGLDREAHRRHVRARDVIERFGDVGERTDAHAQPGLFEQFAFDGHGGGLVPLLAAARQIPQQIRLIGIRVRDDEHAAVAFE